MLRIISWSYGRCIGLLAIVFGKPFALAVARHTLHYTAALTQHDPNERIVSALVFRIPRKVYQDVKVAARRHGVDYELSLDDNAQRVFYLTGTYERAFTRWLLQQMKKDDVFLDVGSHIGIHALAVAKRLVDLGGGSVISIEATPDSSARIRTCAGRNGLNNIQVIEIGAGEADGVLRLYGDEKYGNKDAGVRSAFNKGPLIAEVPVAPLDRVLSGLQVTKIDLVKMDIEGYEHAAIKGMQASLEKLRPRYVVIEIEDVRLQQAGTSETAIHQLLREVGYHYTGMTLLTNAVFKAG